MKKEKYADDSVISTTNYLIDISENPSSIVKAVCETHILTDEFINTFMQYITPEVFTLSQKLSYKMTCAYPDLFNKELLLKAIQEGTVMPSVSVVSAFNLESTDIGNDMLTVIRHADFSDTETAEASYDLIGKFSDEVDNVIIMNIDPESRSSILLNIALNSGFKTYKFLGYLDNASKEVILERTPKAAIFFDTLTQSKDLGWKVSMLDRVSSKEIQFTDFTELTDEKLAACLLTFPEDEIAKFISSGVLKGKVNYNVCNICLAKKAFSEENLISMIETLKHVGLYFKLKEIGKQNNYTNLLSQL